MKPLKFKTQASPDGDAHVIFAYTGTRFTHASVAGSITIRPDATVGWVGVEPAWQRQGLATKLYERAAKLACSKLDQPLHSDSERSAYTESFWRKQVAKGRARCISSGAVATPGAIDPKEPGRVVYGRGGCVRYALSCPAPVSLSRSRR